MGLAAPRPVLAAMAAPSVRAALVDVAPAPAGPNMLGMPSLIGEPKTGIIPIAIAHLLVDVKRTKPSHLSGQVMAAHKSTPGSPVGAPPVGSPVAGCWVHPERTTIKAKNSPMIILLFMPSIRFNPYLKITCRRKQREWARPESDVQISPEISSPVSVFKEKKVDSSMELDFDKIIYSRLDIKRGIKIPTKLTPLLAEDIGFHIGDGCMAIGRHRHSRSLRYYFNYSGNRKKDLHYFENIFLQRKRELFNLNLSIKRRNSRPNEIHTTFYSRAIFDFFQQLGIPAGKKREVEVPLQIKSADLEVKAAFLRGLAAADFCVSVKNRSYGIYPTIHFVSASKKLRDDVCELLREFGIQFTKYKDFQVDKTSFSDPVYI